MRIISILMSLLLLLPPAYSNPPEAEETQAEFNLDNVEATSIPFEPSPFDVQLGDIKLSIEGGNPAYYMMPGTPSHIYGVMVDKDVFTKLEFLANRQSIWCQQRLDACRTECDLELEKRDVACKLLNRDLIQQKIDLTKQVEDYKLQLKDEKLFNKGLLWIGGTVILSLTGTLVYISVSK